MGPIVVPPCAPFLGGHVALLFYDTRAASVLVGVGEGMEKGRKKKNLWRAEHVLLRWPLPQCSTCNPFHWEVDCWVFKTEKTFRTSLSQRGAKVFPVFIICLSNRKTYSELWSSDLEVARRLSAPAMADEQRVGQGCNEVGQGLPLQRSWPLVAMGQK